MFKLKDFEVPEEVFENLLIGLHLKLMRSFGYIVSSQQRNKFFHLLKGAIFICSFAVFCCLIFIKISRSIGSLANGSISCAAGFTYLSTSFATANAFFQRKRVIRMVIFLHEDLTELFRFTDTEEEIILGKTIKYIRIIMTAMGTPSLVAFVIVIADCFYRIIFMPETVFNMPQKSDLVCLLENSLSKLEISLSKLCEELPNIAQNINFVRESISFAYDKHLAISLREQIRHQTVLNGTAQPILLFQLFPFGEVIDNFIVAYIGPFYAMTFAVAAILCWHTFVTCLMKYVVLKYEIFYKRLREYDFTKLSNDLTQDQIESFTAKELQYWHTRMCEFCARQQANLRWFTKELESLLRIPVLLDFIIFSLLMCFLFYAIATGNHSNMDCLFFVMYIFVMCFLLWLYHWHATLVTYSNDGLCFALYCSPWYTFPVNIQKNLLLMMMESAKPLVMKAIFVELNLKTFIDVVRGAYSYFSILRNASVEQ